jgi:hypothetical protein
VGQAFELGGAPFGVSFFKGACGEHGRTMRLLTLFFTRSSCSARAAERPLRRVNQSAQDCINGLLVRKILSPVR